MTKITQLKQYAADTVNATAPTLETLLVPAVALYQGMQHAALHTGMSTQQAAYIAGAGLMGLYNWKGKEIASQLRRALDQLPRGVQTGLHAAVLGGTLATQCNVDLPAPSYGTITVNDNVEDYIESLDLPASERVSVYAHPLGEQDNAFVKINHAEEIRSASANKVYVMMAAYALSEPNTNDINLMIAHSHNGATNRLIDAVGGEDAVNEYISGLGMHDTVVKHIPRSGRTLDNVTTLEDLSTAYQLIYNEDVEHASEMISALNDSPHKDRLVADTCLYDGRGYKLGYRIDDVFHKTGSINGVNIDAGIIEVDFDGEIIPYFVGISFDDPTVGSGSGWAARRSPYARDISELVFANGVYPTYAGQPYHCRTHKGKHGVEQ